MNIYFIRHGETDSNKKGVHQNASTPLSEVGIAQAKQLAQRLKPTKIDRIIASPMIRAQQTAQEIAQVMSINIETNDNLREVKRPSAVEGLVHNDPKALEIKRIVESHAHEPNWHHSDEDNFGDIKNRLVELKHEIEQMPQDDILLVSHGFAIGMFLAVVLMGDDLSPEVFFSNFKSKLEISNTGISHCEYTLQKGWVIKRVNDTNHLNDW